MAGNVRESKTVLTAEDRTGGAFASMRKEVQASQERIVALQGQMAGLAGFLTGGAFAMAMKKAIDDMAAFKDMAIEAGVAGAANIQQFERAFRMAGMAVSDSVGMMQKLSKASIEAEDQTSNAARALEALGISAASFSKLSPDQQLIALAQASQKFAPSASMNAAMMELMGKSGASAQKVLAEIAATMPQVDEAMNKAAEEADKLQDSFVELQIKSDAFMRRGAETLLPYLQNVIDRFVELKGQQDGTVGFFEVVGRVIDFTAKVVGSFWLALKDMGYGIGALAAQGAALMRFDFDAVGEIERRRQETYRANEAAYERLWSASAKTQAMQQGEIDNWDMQGKVVLKYGAAAKAASDEVGKLLQSINGKDAGVDNDYVKNIQLLFGAYQSGRLSLEQYTSAVEKYVKQQKFAVDMAKAEEQGRKELAKAFEEELKAREALARILDEYATSFKDEEERLKFETSLIGLTAAEVARLTEVRRIDLEMRKAAAQLPEDATSAQIQAIIDAADRAKQVLPEMAAKLVQQREEAEQQKGAFKSWFDIIDGGFKAALTGAKSFGDYLKNGLKNALYQLVAQPFIINIAASLTGASSQVVASALGNGIGGAGGLFGSFGGLAGIGGSLASGLSGIGLNGVGQFVGGLTGAISGPGLTGAAGMGASTAGMLSAAGPYVAAALAAYQIFQRFADKGENPKYRLGFGSAAQGYASDSIFGRQGFVYAQGNDAANQGFRAFQQGLGGLDTQLARLLTPEQIAAATGRLNGAQGREFSFPKGDPTASEQLSLEYLKIKYSAVFADFNSQISSTIANFSGKSEDLIKYIGEQVAAYDQLRQMMGAITDEIDGLGRDGLGALSATLDKLRTDIEAAQQAVRDAGEDPTKQLAAQQALIQAIRNRYQTESQLIAQITDQLQAAQQGRFEFAQGMASRLAGVGAPQDRTMAIMQRYQQLQTNISGTNDPTRRIGLINQAVSVIDAFVQNGRDDINRRYEALNRQQQEQIALQSQVFDQRREQLQKELDAFSAMANVADQVRGAIKSIQYSTANPMSAFGRFDVMGQDIGQLQGLFRNSTGSARAGYASQLVTAIQGRLSAAQDLYQRPSDEYLNAYNEAMSALAEVQSAAESDARQAIKLQEQIEALNREQAALQSTLVDYSAQQAQELTSLNEVAAMYYKILAEQGDAAYAAQIDTASRQLNMMVTQAELLSQIRALLQEVLTPSPTGQLNGQFKGAAAPIVIDLQAGGIPLGQYIIDTAVAGAPVLKRALARAGG